MRFHHCPSFQSHSGPYTSEEAVARQTDKESRLTEGHIERLQAQVESLQGIVGRLIDHVAQMHGGNAKDQREAIAEVIGYAWKPEDKT